MVMRTHVDLCSGIGGFALGFLAAELSEPILFCDFDEKVRRLLRVRFPGIPIANDVKEIASDPRKFIRERPFILSSGYPCQPFSASGKRGGEEDPRHIFPHIAEIVAQTRPTYCVFENVYGHISLGLDKVLSQMGSLDYTTATFIVPAAGFRPHKRDRLWIICKNMANTNNEGIWSCERGSDVDNEGSSGERGTNRGGSSSHDEWHDTQTTKDERMDVANTDSRCSDRENKEVRSRGEAIDSSGKTSGIVANANDTRNRASKHEVERERSESIAKGQGESQSELGGQGADVSNTNSNGSSATKERGSFEETIHEEQTRQIGTLDIKGASDLSQATRDVANTKRGSKETQLQWEQRVLREKNKGWQTDRSGSQDISDRGIGETFARFRGIFDGLSGWLDEPRHLERTTHLNEYRAERLKQLGNALLPQITYRIGLAIKECEDDK
jgi:site-specific DNA-cytosine methylase